MSRFGYDGDLKYLPSEFGGDDNAECLLVSKECFQKLYGELKKLSGNNNRGLIERKIDEEYIRRFGKIEKLKENLRLELQDMNEETALGRINNLEMKLRQLAVKDKTDLMKEYIQHFKYELIIIYDRFQDKLWNKISKAWSMIHSMEVNDALMYLYDANTIEEAREKEKTYIYAMNKQKGESGEKEVEYALKWLDRDYIVMSGKSDYKGHKGKILLYNAQFIDEKQEFDHIVIGKQGVILIETKNYAGKIEIDQNGNWIRTKKGGIKVGERNPIQQIRRHEKLVKSIVDVPVMSVICLANSQVIIEGIQNSKVPIIKSDLLVEYIESYRNGEDLSKDEVVQCKESIERHMI